MANKRAEPTTIKSIRIRQTMIEELSSIAKETKMGFNETVLSALSQYIKNFRDVDKKLERELQNFAGEGILNANAIISESLNSQIVESFEKFASSKITVIRPDDSKKKYLESRGVTSYGSIKCDVCSKLRRCTKQGDLWLCNKEHLK